MNKYLTLILASLACWLPKQSLHAEDFYWDGPTSGIGFWNNAANWIDSEFKPVAAFPTGNANIAVFDGFSPDTMKQLGVDISIGGLLFTQMDPGQTFNIGDLNEAFKLTLTSAEGIRLDPVGDYVVGDIFINSKIVINRTSTQNWTNVSDGILTLNSTLEMGAQPLRLNGTGDYIFNGVVSGTSLEMNGSGTLTLNAANTFTGNLRLMDGTTKVNAAPVSGVQLIFGAAATGVQGSDGAAVLELDNTTALDFKLSNTFYVHRTVDSAVVRASGSGSATPVITLNGNRTLMIGDTASEVDLLLQVGLADGTTTSAVTKRAMGTVVMQGVNTYTGSTIIDRGKIVLDYSVHNGDNKLSNATTASLTLRGGELEMRGNSSAATSETTGSMAIGSGTSTLAMISNGGQDVTLNITGNLTRSAQTGVINFTSNDPSKTHLIINGTVPTNTAGFLGGWAAYNGSRWASRNASNKIVALDGTIQNNKNLWTRTDNIIVNGATTGPLGTNAVASLILDNPAGGTFAIDNSGSALTLTHSALMLSSNVTADTIISGGQLLTQNATTGAANELIITNYSTAGKLVLDVNIGSSNNFLSATQNVSLAGPGLIELAGYNSFNGTLNVHGNVLVSDSNALNAYGIVNISTGGNMTENGAKFDINGRTVNMGRLSGGSDVSNTYFDRGPGEIALGSNGHLIMNQTADSTFNGTITGSGQITKKGSGVLTLQTNSSTFTGEVRVFGGGLNLAGASIAFSEISTLRIRGGAVASNQSGSTADKISNTAAIILEGTTGNGFAVTSNQNGSRPETVGSLNLAAGANTITVNNSLATTDAITTSLLFGNTANTLTRGQRSTLLVRGRNLGVAATANNPSGRVIFGTTTTAAATITNALIGTSTTAGATNLKILPYAIGQNSVTSAENLAAVGNSFLTYVTATGVRVLTDAEYTSALTGPVDSNVSLSSTSTLTGLTGQTINSLRLVTGGGNVNLSGTGNLVLTSGALLMTAGSTSNTAEISGFSSITSGTTTNEIVAFVTSNTGGSAAKLTINSNIVNNGQALSLTKSGEGTLELTGTNTYTGETTVNQGVLQFNSAGSLGTGLIRVAGGTLRWGGTNTTDITAGNRTVEMLGSSVYLTPGAGGNIHNAGSFFDIGANNVTLANAIGNNGYGGLTKLGTGTLNLLAGPTYKGATVVAQGAMNFQTIAANTTEALYLVRNTTGTGTVTSTVTSGLNVNSLIVGGAYADAGNTTGTLTVNGGAVSIGTPDGAGFALIGYRDTSSVAGSTNTITTSTADFTAASSVDMILTQLELGVIRGGTATNAVNVGRLLLSNGINNITAGSIVIGNSPASVANASSSNINNTSSLIQLGSSANNFNTDTLVVGGIRSQGQINIRAGGSFKLRGQQGGDTAANLFIGDNDATNTNVQSNSTLDLTGASNVDMKVNHLILGRVGGTTATTGIGYGKGTLTWGVGVIEASTLQMGLHNYSASAVHNPNASLISGGTINQSGNAIMRYMNMSKGAGSATWNWSGGTIQNIANANQVNENVVITLSTGSTDNDPNVRHYTVDENRTATFQADASFSGSGSFTKDGEGALILEGNNTNTGNVHITAGSIQFSGSGSMNDAAWFNIGTNGELDVTARTAGSYISDAVISGTGRVRATNFTVGSNIGNVLRDGVLRPGSSGTNNSAANAASVGNQTGTLSFTGNVILAGADVRVDRAVLQIVSTNFNASSTFGNYGTIEAWVNAIPTDHTGFISGTSGGNYDHISITGQLTVNHNGGITIEGGSYNAVAGDVFNLIDWVGASLDASFTIGNRYRNGTETGLDLILPTLSNAALSWDTSLFRDYGMLVVTGVVPEPTRALLLTGALLGLALHRRRNNPDSLPKFSRKRNPCSPINCAG